MPSATPSTTGERPGNRSHPDRHHGLKVQSESSEAFHQPHPNFRELFHPHHGHYARSQQDPIDTTSSTWTLDDVPDAKRRHEARVIVERETESSYDTRKEERRDPQPHEEDISSEEPLDSEEKELVNENPEDVHRGELPDEFLGDEVEYGDVPVEQDDDEGVYQRGVEVPGADESERLPVEKYDTLMTDATEDAEFDRYDLDTDDFEQNALAVSEKSEVSWDNGFERQEHDPVFQDEAGLDYGDRSEGIADDDEGMDPAENA
ncbi:hypothetical protein HK102_012460 [Quaeritorhiza haematococci]|nr:hypothetical protein HK102_012460 [Quaeritorhiza haematococci]